MTEKYAYRLVIADRKSKWSHMVDVEKVELELTGLGLDGWDMVGIFKQHNASGVAETVFVMKRKLPSTE